MPAPVSATQGRAIQIADKESTVSLIKRIRQCLRVDSRETRGKKRYAGADTRVARV